MERVPNSFVSDDLRERHSDVIWRLRFREENRDWLYLYLLLEFQSTSYHFMAVRLLSYVSLLLEEIIRPEKLRAGDRLPAVLPLVIHNGKRPWPAPRDLRRLFVPLPESLRRRLPQLSNHALDQGRLDLNRPELTGNRPPRIWSASMRQLRETEESPCKSQILEMEYQCHQSRLAGCD